MENQENQSDHTSPNIDEELEGSQHPSSGRDELSESDPPAAFESISPFT